jgi:adenosine deaminase CECR1
MEPVVEDENRWHEEEGVPRLQDQFIQKYLNGRDALVEQEKKQRSGIHCLQLLDCLY